MKNIILCLATVAFTTNIFADEFKIREYIKQDVAKETSVVMKELKNEINYDIIFTSSRDELSKKYQEQKSKTGYLGETKRFKDSYSMTLYSPETNRTNEACLINVDLDWKSDLNINKLSDKEHKMFLEMVVWHEVAHCIQHSDEHWDEEILLNENLYTAYIKELHSDLFAQAVLIKKGYSFKDIELFRMWRLVNLSVNSDLWHTTIISDFKYQDLILKIKNKSYTEIHKELTQAILKNESKDSQTYYAYWKKSAEMKVGLHFDVNDDETAMLSAKQKSIDLPICKFNNEYIKENTSKFYDITRRYLDGSVINYNNKLGGC